MKTWEVKLLAGNNGVVQTNVVADWYRVDPGGVTLYNAPEGGDLNEVAFFPLDKLLSVKDVTP